AARVAIFGSCLLLGLVLAADFVLVRLLGVLRKGGWRLLQGIGRLGRWLGQKNRDGRTDGQSVPQSQTVLASAKIRDESSETPVEDCIAVTSAPPATKAPPSSGAPIPIRHHDEAIASLRGATVDILAPKRQLTLESEEDRFADYELPPLTLLEDPQPF